MGKLAALVLALALLLLFSEASPILSEKQAKQLLRSRRQDRPSKPGFPDEPMRQARTWGTMLLLPFDFKSPKQMSSDLMIGSSCGRAKGERYKY
ncbi:uncharacterized protein C17orf67 homolog isoform X1 [Dipodomys spectabilis]|uniref:uncharacterized protein C17orf67 homolog isoform X1 n=1 Tax=Dipodomys spectabilis TaxID=105255 RepID=UPI001C542757|nr:uncharacterized protein C17orf67 homolog isoform X1 [Dipodomys spectabilis]